MRITVAHEWLTNWAGSECVAEQLVQVSGARRLVAAIVDRTLASDRFPRTSVEALWPSSLPHAQTNWSRYALPMMAAWATTRIEADALLISSHFAAHAAARRFDGPSIVYHHTPSRLLWRPDIELSRLPAMTRRAVRHGVLPPLRAWDRYVAQQATVLLANSSAVARRIEIAHRRTARVVHPPVEVERWQTVEHLEGSHVLWFGRLVGYKRPEIAVEAARMSGLPLVIAGDGPERERLEDTAPPGTRFIGRAPWPVVREAMMRARVLVFPGEEDFGIAPVEALAAGVPVVAAAVGGALDYVHHGENGLLVEVAERSEDQVVAMAAALRQAWDTRWDHAQIRRTAESFSVERFRENIAEVLDDTLGTAWRRERVAT
ncbi:glycosyltransferase involved in cell wall biosynthesis [Actinomycetospora succinea]|uniref:Glycosyltransferase involved in cell wall biosynthesis n=1 Tax=Actinomycetospora succinea TaxID=663603 RepID=A0A4R6UPQ6_9PSEU|nr:glycosyltransferase [Actinomycetospora succinea]TDQ48872.1 glycosyltransferase involved in cell wall biosynthesis [Actinomycetospora succinea]